MVRNWMKHTLCAALGAVTLMFAAPKPSQAQALEIVFIDSLWGGGIGAVSGLALWAWNDQESTDLTSMVARGTAIGIFGGMVFGLYEITQQDDMFAAQNDIAPSLFNYHSAENKLVINPMPLAGELVQRSREEDVQTQLPLLRVTF